jgi:hypothetical protein
MSAITILFAFCVLFAILAAYCACRMVFLKDDLEVERACHRLTRAHLDALIKSRQAETLGK